MTSILNRLSNIVRSISTDVWILVALMAARILLQTFTNGAYGFHRDELGTLDAGRDLAWGYVAYPPLTPFIGRLALAIFGSSLNGLRFFSVLAQGLAMLVTGLMVRSLCGSRTAQVFAALAVGFSPSSISIGTVFQYVTFDYLWWVLIGYFVIRLRQSGDARWWLAIGAAVGLGMLTKYTILVLVIGVVVGFLLSGDRSQMRSRWLWLGAALSLFIALPNLVWQFQNHWISMDFLSSIHARDVLAGKSASFFLDQLKTNSPPILLLAAPAGLYFLFVRPGGKTPSHDRMDVPCATSHILGDARPRLLPEPCVSDLDRGWRVLGGPAPARDGCGARAAMAPHRLGHACGWRGRRHRAVLAGRARGFRVVECSRRGQ
jgi:4-amino-4-deoxy-L-arabinose transferase-like glycosyltransferase